MTFAYPIFFILYLFIIPLLIYLWKRPLPSLKVSFLKLFQDEAKQIKNPKSKTVFAIYAISLFLFIFALARPRYGSEHSIVQSKGIDIILGIDLSGSMNAVDIPRSVQSRSRLKELLESKVVKNRLEVAKLEIKKFIEKRKNDRIGLIGFGNQPFVVCPPTIDHNYLLEHLKSLEAGAYGNATGIAGAISSGVTRLKDAKSKRQRFILFTDGANTVEAKITPIQAAKIAKKYKIGIYCIGIGSDNAYQKAQSIFGTQWQPSPGSFDEPMMKKIAKMTNGQYYRAKDSKGLEKAMKEIDKLETIDFEQPKYIDYNEYAPKIIFIALILLLLGFILEHTIMLRIP